MNRKLWIIGLVLLIFLSGCETKKKTEKPDEKDDVVIKVTDGDYDIITPFKSSPIRYMHGVNYREKDIVEIGRRLIEKSKEHFSVKDYRMSEGQVLTEKRYKELMVYKSDNNPNGLMTRYPDGLDIDGAHLEKPEFLSGIFEIDFHKTDSKEIDAVSIALVLKRNQFTNSQTGATHSLSDDALYKIGQAMGLQLSAYIRSLDSLTDVPIYIALYAQSSDMDQLPDNYLPGYYIGDALSTGNSANFKKNNEKWIMLTDQAATKAAPELVADFMKLKQKVTKFTADESTTFIGRAFMIDGKVASINFDVIVGAKTFLELYSVGQFITQEMNEFDSYNVDVEANIKVYQNTRAVAIKRAGEKAIFEVFE